MSIERQKENFSPFYSKMIDRICGKHSSDKNYTYFLSGEFLLSHKLNKKI